MKERSIHQFADKQGLKRRVIHAPGALDSWKTESARLPERKATEIELEKRWLWELNMTNFAKHEKNNRARDLARGAYLFRVTEDILVAMEDLGVTKAELAKRLGLSKPRITQLLSGSSNMTIGTLSDIAVELGLSLDKTFKEYSLQRYHLDNRPSNEQPLSEPGFAASSFKNS